MRRLVILAAFAVAAVASAEKHECPSTLLVGLAPVKCATSRSGARLFTCAEREAQLRAAGIRYETLDSWFAEGLEEHTLVKIAIERTIAADVPDGVTRAMLWEELTARIDRRLERPVSKSFRGTAEGSADEFYVFQGMKRFHGKAYLLVVLPTGEVYSGPVEPLEDLGNWAVHRDALALKSP